MVAFGAGALKLWVALAGSMQALSQGSDLQDFADRLDPERVTVAVNEIDQDLTRRSSTAWA